MIGKKNLVFKDLNRINRSKNKVVAVDFENHYIGSKNNVIKLKKYSGEEDDKELKIL